MIHNKEYDFKNKIYVLDNLLSSDNSFTRKFINNLHDNIIYEDKDIISDIKIIDYDFIINLVGIASPYYYSSFR